MDIEVLNISELKDIEKEYNKKQVVNFKDILDQEFFVTTGRFFNKYINNKLQMAPIQFNNLKKILLHKTKVFAR